MAEIAKTIDSFDKNIKIPAVGPEGIGKSIHGIPSNFLTFYNNLIALISQYQKAFENENFNRMGQYVIAINEAISNFFKGSSSEITKSLNEISERTAKAAKELIENKISKSYSKDFVKDKITEIVEQYKDKIIEKVKLLSIQQTQNTTSTKDSETNKSSSKSADNEIDYASIPNVTIDAANKLLKKQNSIYAVQIHKFAVSLGKEVISTFKDTLKRVNADSLKTIKSNIDVLSKQYDQNFLSVLNIVANAENSQKTLNKLLNSRLARSSVHILNAFTKSLDGILRSVFAVRAVKRILFFWGGKILSPIGKILNFTKNLFMGALSLFAKSVKFVLKTALGIVVGAAKTIKNVVMSSFGLAKKLHEMLTKHVGLNIGAMFGAFIMSYPGAYILGYLTGIIWKSILKLAGLSDEQIAGGDYSIKDDVLTPFINSIKERYNGVKEKFLKFFSGTDESGSTIKEEIAKKIKESPTISKLITTAKDITNFIKDIKLRDIMIYVKEVNEEIIKPVAEFLGPLGRVVAAAVNMIGKGAIEEPRIFKRSLVGASVGLSSLARLEKFFKHVKIKGGLSLILAGGIAAGAAAILGQGKTEEKASNDDDYPTRFGISKKYSNLWKPADAEKSVVEKTKDTFGNLLREIDKIDDKDKYKAELKDYGLLTHAYSELLREQAELLQWNNDLTAFSEYYNKNKGNLNETESLVGTDIAKAILFYKGSPILSESFSNIRGLDNQLAVLDAVLKQRKELVTKQIKDFANLVESGTNASEILKKVNEQKLHMPDFMKTGSISFGKFDPNDLIGGGAKLSISLQGGYSDISSDKTKSEKSPIGQSFQKGIDIGMTLRPLSLNQAAAKDLEIVKSSKEYLENAQRIFSNAQKMYYRSPSDFMKNGVSKNPYIMRYVNYIRKYHSNERFELYESDGSLYHKTGDTINILDILKNSKTFGESSSLFKEFVDYTTSIGHHYSKQKSFASTYNLQRLYAILYGILQIFKDRFITDFTSFIDDKKLGLDINVATNILNKLVSIKFESIIEDNVFRSTLLTANGNDIATDLLKKGFDTFTEVLDDFNKENQLDENIKEALDNFYKEKGEKKKYLEGVKQAADKFLLEQTDTLSILNEIKELLRQEENKEE